MIKKSQMLMLIGILSRSFQNAESRASLRNMQRNSETFDCRITAFSNEDIQKAVDVLDKYIAGKSDGEQITVLSEISRRTRQGIRDSVKRRESFMIVRVECFFPEADSSNTSLHMRAFTFNHDEIHNAVQKAFAGLE